jgi:AcrR family transcriptional regulator
VPKISAPTVAEHRAARRAALLEAAVGLLAEQPDRVPSLAAVGKRAGLSRPSVYHYFTSAEALVAAVVEEAFPRWERRFDDALAEVGSPAERIRVYARENLRLVADGEFALANTLATILPGNDLSARATRFHQRLLEPVRGALEELDVPDPVLSADLLNALVLAGCRAVDNGVEVDAALAGLLRVLDPFLDAWSAPTG